MEKVKVADLNIGKVDKSQDPPLVHQEEGEDMTRAHHLKKAGVFSRKVRILDTMMGMMMDEEPGGGRTLDLEIEETIIEGIETADQEVTVVAAGAANRNDTAIEEVAEAAANPEEADHAPEIVATGEDKEKTIVIGEIEIEGAGAKVMKVMIGEQQTIDTPIKWIRMKSNTKIEKNTQEINAE